MRGLLFAVALTCAASLPTVAQTDAATTQQGSAVEQDVLKLQRELKAAEDPKTVSPETFERLVADDAVMITPEGKFTKSQAVSALRGLAAASKDPKTFIDVQTTVTGERAHVFGDTAVVVSDAHIRGQEDGRIMEDVMTITTVWVRRAGRWQLVLNNIVSKGQPKTHQIKEKPPGKNN